MTMHHACYTGPCEHQMNDGSVRHFKPSGPLHVVHVRGTTRRSAREASASKRLGFNSKLEPWSAEGLAGRLFVGLKVGNTLKWTLEDVMKATYEYLTQKASLSGNSTFLAQKGWYNGTPEDSVQIVIFDESEKPLLDVWTKMILTLGAFLRERFEQESVVVEIQKGGVTQSLQGVKKDG
jgi:hypothetical protein